MTDIPRPPRGLDEIKAVFGDPALFTDEASEIDMTSPEFFDAWEFDRLKSLHLPAPLKLSWADIRVKRIRCNRLILPVFDSVYKAIHEAGLWNEIDPFGGCYCFRRKSSSGSELSTHSWGIAVDHRPGQNVTGAKGTMHPKVIEIFRSYGFTWGGDWRGPWRDPMHYNYCSGY